MEQLKNIEMVSLSPEDEILKDGYQLSRETALHYAVKYCKPDVIQYILCIAPKIDVNVRDIFGTHLYVQFHSGVILMKLQVKLPSINWQHMVEERLAVHG